MNPNTIIENCKKEFSAASAHFDEELKKLRTGRAHPSMLDGVVAMAYGAPMPLIQLATVTAPEAQLLQIAPFDPSTLQAINTSIRENQSLGLNPSDDGRVIRLPIPPLTTERRAQIVKQLNEKVEECMIAMRSVRHDALRDIKKAKDDKLVGEDEQKRLEKQVDEAMNTCKSNVELAAKTREKEIMTV